MITDGPGVAGSGPAGRGVAGRGGAGRGGAGGGTGRGRAGGGVGAAARPGDPRRGVAVLTVGSRRRSPSGVAGGSVRGRVVWASPGCGGCDRGLSEMITDGPR